MQLVQNRAERAAVDLHYSIAHTLFFRLQSINRDAIFNYRCPGDTIVAC